ncbi:MAG: zf-HC2 domain-containing protein [Myxococcales bacterium]|nr:zf-HC2 domain-containing protein [Myxococcales bacterium]
MRPTITCRELESFILDYLEGTLTHEQRDEFEYHLSLCPPCVDYLSAYKTTIELGKLAFDADAEGPPEGMPEDLILAILRTRDREEIA